jgi:transposase-like protein
MRLNVKVAGQWVYLYRAIDHYGQVIDVFASDKRDLTATRRFFARALEHAPHPAKVTAYRQRATALPHRRHGLSRKSVKRLLHIAAARRISATRRATKPTPTRRIRSRSCQRSPHTAACADVLGRSLGAASTALGHLFDVIFSSARSAA